MDIPSKLSKDLEQQIERTNWTSVNDSIENIRAFSDHYKVPPKTVWKTAEATCIRKMENATRFHPATFEWSVAVLLVIGGVLAVYKAYTPDGLSSGLFFGKVAVAPWLWITAVFVLLHPKHSSLLIKASWWWTGVLGTIITVIFPIWINSTSDPDGNKIWGILLKIVLYALFWMAFVLLAGAKISSTDKKMKHDIRKLDKEYLVITAAGMAVYGNYRSKDLDTECSLCSTNSKPERKRIAMLVSSFFLGWLFRELKVRD